MTWKLETDYGTLELPRFDCLVCFSKMCFMSCTMCPVTREFAHKANDIWPRIWDELQEKKEERE